jgi:hypothetical protein
MKFAQARLSPPGLAQIMAKRLWIFPILILMRQKAEYLSRRI